MKFCILQRWQPLPSSRQLRLQFFLAHSGCWEIILSILCIQSFICFIYSTFFLVASQPCFYLLFGGCGWPQLAVMQFMISWILNYYVGSGQSLWKWHYMFQTTQYKWAISEFLFMEEQEWLRNRMADKNGKILLELLNAKGKFA